MVLFKGKEDIPELPRMPSLADLNNSISRQISNLPTLPPRGESIDALNQEMVKSAINEISNNTFPEEEEGVTEGLLPQNEEERINSPSLNNHFSLPLSTRPQKDTIYVKIDKFQAFQTALGDIQQKVRELSKQVQTLKEIKTKELEDLSRWDEEIKRINQRLTRIDAGIFGEV